MAAIYTALTNKEVKLNNYDIGIYYLDRKS